MLISEDSGLGVLPQVTVTVSFFLGLSDEGMTSENSFFIQLLSVPSFCSFYVLANFSNIFSRSLPLQKPWSVQSLLAFPLFLIF